MLHAAHLWDWTPFDVSTDVCEESYFYKTCKPSCGLWVAWVPKDSQDSELFQE